MDVPTLPHTQAVELDLLLAEADQDSAPVGVPPGAAHDEDPGERLDRQILAGLVSV